MKRPKKSVVIYALSAALITAITLTSCASDSRKAQSEKGTEATESPEGKTPDVEKKTQSDKPFGIDEDRYAELLDMSFISTGNTYRLKKVIEKLRAGENVYIAALGGSVTEGAGPSNYKDGYAYQFNKKLRAAYTPNDGANVYFDGAGLSGTPSQLGLVRYQSDVVDVLGHTPDLLIIEFAVNDDGSDLSTRAFEALVRNALEANDECAVIALYSAATYGNTANQKKVVANYYGIPQVNVLALVQRATSANDFTKTDYYTDTVHPTKAGHEIQADCLMNLLAKTDAAPAEEAFAIPENWCRPKPLTNFTRILGDDENVKITAGVFGGTDDYTQSIKKTGKGNFPKNWHHASGKGSFVMEINCKALILTYKEQGSWLSEKFGKADVYVDGQLKATYDGGKAGGWCNCVPVYIIDEEVAAKHTVEIKMADGEESKGFTIVAMGYSR